MPSSGTPYRILSLDGGGAKGFYTLGVLHDIEAMLGKPLHEHFHLIYGTSTGAIIASLVALGHKVAAIHDLYRSHVPTVMSKWLPSHKTAALASLATDVFGSTTFSEMKTGIGIVTARWLTERPMIFKANIDQTHGGKATFVPGFGVPVADAVEASCSAYPFFKRKTVTTSTGEAVELLDGGYCANNPTLYAIADALVHLHKEPAQVRVLNIGVGEYPQPRRWKMWIARKATFGAVQLLQKTMEINVQSMDQLRAILYHHVPTIRISDAYTHPEMATDLLEHNLKKLNQLWQRGRESFSRREEELRAFLT